MQPLQAVAPGLYAGDGLASLLRVNEQQFLFQKQAVTGASNGQSSISVMLERIKSAYFSPFAVSLQIWFTDVNGNPANPGTFEIDAQTSDVDADKQYCVETGLTSLNSSYVGRIQLTVSWMRFVRVNIKTITNPVYIWVLASR